MGSGVWGLGRGARVPRFAGGGACGHIRENVGDVSPALTSGATGRGGDNPPYH